MSARRRLRQCAEPPGQQHEDEPGGEHLSEAGERRDTVAVIVTGSAIDSPAGVSSWTVIGDVPFDLARTGMTNEVSSFGSQL